MAIALTLDEQRFAFDSDAMSVHDAAVSPFLEQMYHRSGIQAAYSHCTDEGDDIYDFGAVQYLMNVQYFKDDIEVELDQSNEVRVSLQPFPWF